MTFRGEIPGFYYDREKGKYFSIQANHKVPQNASHSRQNVKAEKKAKLLLNLQQTRQQREEHELAKRAPWLVKGRSLISTRLGQNIQSAVDHVRSQYAGNLSAPSNEYPKISTGKCNNFVLSKAGPYCRLTSRLGSNSVVCMQKWKKEGQLQRLILPGPYTGGGQSMTIVNDQFLIISDFPGLYTLQIDTNGDLPHDDIFGYIQPSPETQIWELAAAPDGLNWAAAAEEGLYVGDTIDGTGLGLRQIKSIKTEQRTVMFRDHNIVMSGERSGSIHLSDLRVRNSVLRLKHSPAVNGIVNARNPNHVIVGGFSTVAIYDLRFTRKPKPRPNRSNSAHIPRSKAVWNISLPPDRVADQYCQGKQLAYSTELDIIVHATTHSQLAQQRYEPNLASHVTLYAGSTGKVLPSPLSSHHFHQPVDAIAMQRVRDGPESIFVLSDNQLQEWSLYDHSGEDGSEQSKSSRGRYDLDYVSGIDDIYRNA